jgi:hypothetical protein
VGKLIVAGVVIFELLQMVRPAIPTQPATAELQAPGEVKQLIERGRLKITQDAILGHFRLRKESFAIRGGQPRTMSHKR